MIEIIIMLVCLIFSAFFSSSETAYTSFNRTKMKTKAAEGRKKAALAMKLSDSYDKLISTILVGNNIVNITLSSVATVWFVKLMNNHPSAPTVSTVLVTVVVLLIGEITPKVLAKDFPEAVAMAFARPLQVILILLYPVNALFMLWRRMLTKIFKKKEETVTEGELLTLVDEAHEDGSIDEYDKELIENIFDFDDLSAAAIATHRTDLVVLFEEEEPEQWDAIIRGSRFSRFPLCRESEDNVIGILDTKLYFRLEDKSRENILANAVHPVYFVPETVKLDILFRNMKQRKESVAVVLDEYGGVFGIVTITDLVECLVGEFTENAEEETNECLIEIIGAQTWNICGSATVAEVEEALALQLRDCDSDTFNGYVLGLYGSIPEDGSEFDLSTEELDIHITKICEHKIEKAVVIRKTPAETTEEAEADAAE
ncbi:MAG: HlyC/CorC family transporter [Clostridia bacterium]|nr:HlyC/CorC family transporter [Clostridia bacterium]